MKWLAILGISLVALVVSSANGADRYAGTGLAHTGARAVVKEDLASILAGPPERYATFHVRPCRGKDGVDERYRFCEFRVRGKVSCVGTMKTREGRSQFWVWVKTLKCA